MTAPTLVDTTRLLRELEPVVEENLERHLGVAKEWMPHEYVPWGQGRDFADMGGEAWSPDQSVLSPTARTALEVNLLTEDNLPSYHREIERAFGRDGAWGTWVHRWTAGTASEAATTCSSRAASTRSRSSGRGWRSWGPASTAVTSRSCT